MSHFYGIVAGAAKTQATRRGHKRTGLSTTAASWKGCIEVVLSERNGVDGYSIVERPWRHAGIHRVICEWRPFGKSE